MTRLVLITGPVASGKTTLANGLAAEARRRGLRAASIDFDDLVDMVAGRSQRWTSEYLYQARRLAAALIERLVQQEVSLIALAGPFFRELERDDLLQQLAPSVSTSFVVLRVSLAESLRRIEGDDSRVVTRDTAFVVRLYEAIDWSQVPREALSFNTDGLSADELLDEVAGRVLETVAS